MAAARLLPSAARPSLREGAARNAGKAVRWRGVVAADLAPPLPDLAPSRLDPAPPPPDLGHGNVGAVSARGTASAARRRRRRRREGAGGFEVPWRHGVGSKDAGRRRQRAAVAAVEARRRQRRRGRRRQRRRHGRPWPAAWWLWLASGAGAGGSCGRGLRWPRRWLAVQRQRLLQRWRQRLVGYSRWLDDGSNGYCGDRGYRDRRHGGDRG
ncbi:hypothetical protein OsI_22534 [Oryza sativa Indica Group]|uniref:Uncharacterized protein n=1 Tax=Oryza sativa subsp. indica TaxID=39946 RepID=A2YBQ6_ORYSI|nr:hypothetical protein OsI_22534 [Oryza sativa Indica Group]